MPAAARFDLKMDAEEKDIVSRAAALMGTTMAAFVRMMTVGLSPWHWALGQTPFVLLSDPICYPISIRFNPLR